MSATTGDRIKVLTEEEAKYFSEQLNIPFEELNKSSSNYWRDHSFVMHGEKVDLDDEEPSHLLEIKMLSKDNRVAISEEDLKNKPKAEYILIKETEVVANKVAKRKVKADAYHKFTLMSDEDLSKVLLVLGKNPKSLSLDKIKEIITDEIEANPDRFLAFVEDKNFNIKVFINDMVQEGVVRKSGSSYIFDGEMIAHDVVSMIEYLKNPKNSNTVVAFKKMLNEKNNFKKYQVKE